MILSRPCTSYFHSYYGLATLLPLLAEPIVLCRAAFRTIAQLQQAHPDKVEATSWDMGLAPVVDTCARSVHAVDAAFFLLEDMHAQVRA